VLGEGDHCRVYLEGDRVHKVARHAAAARALAREATFLEKCASRLVPRVLDQGPGYLVQSFVAGSPLDAQEWLLWSPYEQDRLRDDLWDFLGSLPRGWIHGDLSPDHLRIENRKLVGVIDFGDVSPGQLDYELRYLPEDLGLEFFRHFCPDPQLYHQAIRFSMLDSLGYLLRHPECQTEIERQLQLQEAEVGALPERMFRQAVVSDAEELAGCINRAYRSGQGWSHEAALLEGPRTSAEELETELFETNCHLESMWSHRGQLLGCVCWERRQRELHLGMLSVLPEFQDQRLGAALLERTHQQARDWQCTQVRLTVIAQRQELVDYYRRRGFSDTGRRLPFPDDPRVGRPRVELELMEMSQDCCPD